MDYQQLKTDLQGDAQYAALIAKGQDADIARLLNSVKTDAVQPIAVLQALLWAAGGPRAVIEDVANESSNPLRAAALVVLDLFRGGVDQLLPLDIPEIRKLFDGLVTPEQKTSLLESATVSVSSTIERYGREITADDVAQALRGAK